MIHSSHRTKRVRAALCAVSALVVPDAGRTAAPAGLVFGPPVRVSAEMSEAWEPSMLADRFGNIFIHARKALSDLALALDDRSATLTRSQSWLWASSDGGKTFPNLPGYPLDVQNHEWGYEGDFALDDAGHLYFVDQTYADSTFSRWSITGPGAYAMDLHWPFVPTAQPVDDRPFLAAHGDGNVFYIVNSGDPTLNPTGRDGGDAYGAGRFTVYHSTDGGSSFDTIGHSLKESGGCRHAADHHSPFVYIVCTNDGGAQSGPLDTPHGRGALWAYVSADDGTTYSRHRVGDYNADAETYDWPLVTVAPNGDVWALHIDAGKTETDADGVTTAVTNTLNLFHSTDHGVTWSKRDVTPEEGPYRWGTLVVANSGEIGLAVQHRPNNASPWRAYAAVFAPESLPTLTAIDIVDAATAARPPSELIGMAFLPDHSVAVAWTRVEAMNGLRFLRVYFARTAAPAMVKGVRKTRSRDRLPATGGGDHRDAALLVLCGAALLSRRVARHPARRS